MLADRRLLIFCGCTMLFTFANAPMLVLMSGTMTAKVGNPSLLIAACIVLPQIIVAIASPAMGRLAERRGRRIVLMIGFCMLPLRGLLFATSTNPTLVVAVQALDGIGGACFGIMVPLIVSDVAARSGHFNLSLGFVGFAVGIGGPLSTSAAVVSGLLVPYLNLMLLCTQSQIACTRALPGGVCPNSSHAMPMSSSERQ